MDHIILKPVEKMQLKLEIDQYIRPLLEIKLVDFWHWDSKRPKLVGELRIFTNITLISCKILEKIEF